MRDSITIERVIKASPERVFKAFVTPEDLIKWHNAGEGWTTPYAEVDPQVGGKIKIGYADPDGNIAFDFGATIDEFDPPHRLAYHLGIDKMIQLGERLVTIDFIEVEGGTKVVLELDVEHVNSIEKQREGWSYHIDNLQRVLETR